MKRRLVLFIAIVLLFLLALTGCSAETATETTPPPAASEPAKAGDSVSVHYTGTLLDGTIFDSSHERGQALSFTLGNSQMVPGFDAAIHGMIVGETKTVTLPPEEAYGDYNPDMFVRFTPDEFPEDMTPTVGMRIPLQTVSGQVFYGVITRVTADYVTIDVNHELVGKTLVFEIELVSITPAS